MRAKVANVFNDLFCMEITVVSLLDPLRGFHWTGGPSRIFPLTNPLHHGVMFNSLFGTDRVSVPNSKGIVLTPVELVVVCETPIHSGVE